MENLENFEPIPTRFRDRLRLEFIDRYPKKYQRVAVVAAAVATSVLTALAVHQEITYEPTYEDRLDAEYTEFWDCLATEPSAASNYLRRAVRNDHTRQIDLQFAFPEYQLDPELQVLVDQCREEHPMPQPVN